MGRRKNFKDGDTSKGLIEHGWVGVAESGKFKLLKMKDEKDSIILPPYSNTPNRVYGIMEKDGKTLKHIGIYDENRERVYRIDYGHTGHHGHSPHLHDSKNVMIEFTKHTNNIRKGYEKWVEYIRKKNF